MVARNYSYHNPGAAKGETGGLNIGFTMILIIIRLACMEKRSPPSVIHFVLYIAAPKMNSLDEEKMCTWQQGDLVLAGQESRECTGDFMKKVPSTTCVH